mgnify:CR=1 FL=1
MKKVMFMFISLLTVLGVCSCNDNEVIEPVVSDSVSDMEVLSRFVDVNEITNEYYFNENKKTRALSYVTGSDWQDLEKVSPLSIEKYKNNLQVLNAQVASAISNPNTAYVVFSVNGKTLVKKVKEDANFDFGSGMYFFTLRLGTGNCGCQYGRSYFSRSKESNCDFSSAGS